MPDKWTLTRFFIPLAIQAASQALSYPLVAMVASRGPGGPLNLAGMAQAFTRFMAGRRDVGGIISAGGSGGTALVTPAMRSLPVGVPKVMVSTVASGNVRQYVGPSDICMIYSVTDVAGINRISASVLSNAAHALAGMIGFRQEADRFRLPAIGLTMFGVTTPCVQAVTKALKMRYDCLVFHATGTGGQSMEKLAESGMLEGVIDITTTEVADFLGHIARNPSLVGGEQVLKSEEAEKASQLVRISIVRMNQIVRSKDNYAFGESLQLFRLGFEEYIEAVFPELAKPEEEPVKQKSEG